MPLLLRNGDQEFREREHLSPPTTPLDQCVSEIVVPLVVKGKVLGTFSAITFQQGFYYTQNDLDTLQAFAEQGAAIIWNVQHLVEARQLRQSVAHLARRKGVKNILNAIVVETHKLISSDFTGLILQDKNGYLEKIKPVIPAFFFDKFDNPRQQGGITRKVIDSQKPIIIHDTKLDINVKEKVREFGIRSMLVLPLIHRSKTLGVLYAHSKNPQHFGSHDVNLLSTFATQAAAALDRAKEEEKENNDFRRLADALGVLTNNMNIENTIKQVSTQAQMVFEADSCRLAYIDPLTDRIIKWDWSQNTNKKYRFERGPRSDGVTFEVMHTQKPAICSLENIIRAPSELRKLGLKSFASLPLVANKRTIGVIHCNYYKYNEKISDRLLVLMEAFGTRSAMALDRARREEIGQIWRQLDQEIITCSNLNDLYQLFTQKALDALNAEFAVFYPSNPTTSSDELVLINDKTVVLGEHKHEWVQPVGGKRGQVYQEILKNPDGTLIVNDIDSQQTKYHSTLSQREKIKAFVAIRLNVIPVKGGNPKVAGLLFLNYRKPTHFQPDDLIDLQHAGNLIASSILRLNLLADFQRTSEQHTIQLGAFLDIFKSFKNAGNNLDLNLIAEHTIKAFTVDACTIVEFNSKKKRFSDRGTAGLKYPTKHYTFSPEYQEFFQIEEDFLEINDIQSNPLMNKSDFVKREKIKSVFLYPLLVDEQPLGLLFINFRTIKQISIEEKESIGMFASLTALFLHQEHLGHKLDQSQQRLDRRLFLDWVSMIEATWRHSLVQKTSSIQNYTTVLQKRLERIGHLPDEMAGIPDHIEDINRLATDIANAPPRVPQSWEMERETLFIGPILEIAADREKKLAEFRQLPAINIFIQAEDIANTKTKGFKRWLIYTIEALLQNARNAMPDGGDVTLHYVRNDEWVEIRVTDTGKGISRVVQKRIFKELIPREEDKNGMGIGSLLAATIIEEHDGMITVEKTGNTGTTILIRLPAI